MDEARWLDEREQRAWRALMVMQEGLSEFLERRLRTRCGLSQADYQVLAHLSEAPEGRLRPFELGAAAALGEGPPVPAPRPDGEA